MGSGGIALLLGLLALSAEFPFVKAGGRNGYCLNLPMLPRSPSDGSNCNECGVDADCPVDKKCCDSPCGNTCQTPEPNHCKLPPALGPCMALHTKVYYNWGSRRCEEFLYGGCLGNPNRFDTEEMCQLACGGQGPPLSQGERR